MKITLVGPVYPYRGGIAHFTTALALRLGMDHQCEVLSFKRLYPNWLYPGESDLDVSEDYIEVPASRSLDTMNPLSWRTSANWILDHHPDGVVIQWWTTFLGPSFYWLAKKICGANIPLSFIIHNVLPHEPRFIDESISKAVLQRGSGHIVLSSREEERLRDLIPAVRNVDLCSHPVYDILASPPPTKAEAKILLNLPEEVPMLLFFGFVRPYKGLNILLEALSFLMAEGYVPHIIIAGEIWEGKKEYLQLIEQLEIGHLVHIIDKYIPNEDIPMYFSAADIFVAPYTQGTQSGSANIAVAYGLPMVVSSQIAEGIDSDGETPVLSVPPGDSQALKTAILDCLRSGTQETSKPMQPLGSDGWGDLVDAITGQIKAYQTNQ